MTTTTNNQTVKGQAPVVLRLLATPDPELVSVLTQAGWTPVLPDGGTPTWIRTGGGSDALAR